MPVTTDTTTSDVFVATVSATFDGPDSDSALLAAMAALRVAASAGRPAATDLQNALAAEVQRRGLDGAGAEADMRDALQAHLTA